MKKLTLLLACMMVFASIATVCASASDVTYTAAYAETKPVIDGVYDAAWDAAATATASVPSNANMGSTQAPTFKVLHDDLYIYCLMQYTDLNGTIPQSGKHYGEKWDLGAETAIFAFIDDAGKQQEFMFTSPAEASGSLSTNVYINVQRAWVKNLANAADGEEGFYAWATRTGNDICWELRIPKAEIGTIDNTVAMDVCINDSGAPNIWSMEEFSWAAVETFATPYKHLLDTQNFGTLTLAAKVAADTSADTSVDTSADDTTANTPTDTTAGEVTDDNATQTPATADAGLAIAAVVMAAAAMVVLRKKH